MIDHLVILAEGAAHEGGAPAWMVGVGMFIVLMSLLGIVLLATSGLNQRVDKDQRHLDA